MGIGSMPILRWVVVLALSACAAAQQVAEPVRAEARDHNQKGIALARSGNHIAAVKEFREAVALRPDYGEAHFNLGISLTQLGEVNAAVHSFARRRGYVPIPRSYTWLWHRRFSSTAKSRTPSLSFATRYVWIPPYPTRTTIWDLH
jgi:tetratricopeptide (TPR) repeat protein